MGLLQALGLPPRSDAGSPAAGSSTPRPQAVRPAEGPGPFSANERPRAGPDAPQRALPGDDTTEDEQASPLDEGKVSTAPAPVGNEQIYRNNLMGIQAELDGVLNATPPDKPSADVQKRVLSVFALMQGAALGSDFDQANVYADELPGLLAEYKRAVAAHAKRAKADQDAQAAFEARHAQVEWEIEVVVDYKAPDGDASSIQDEIVRQKMLMDVAVLEANFAAANVQLDAIVPALARFRDALKRHDQAISDQWIKDAPKRAFEAGFAGIKARLDAISKLGSGSTQPFVDQLKRIAGRRAALLKLLSVKGPDYAAASRLVDELRRLIVQYDLSVAARQKVADDAAEAKAKSTYLVGLRFVDDSLRLFQDTRASGGAPFDKAAGAVLDVLLKARADYDSNESRWKFRERQLAIEKMKVLIENYKTASSRFWEGTYKSTRARIGDKDLKWVLDPAWGDGAMKQEQQKVEQLRKDMEKAAAAKSFYVATEKASILYHELWRLQTIVYAVPAGNGAKTAVRPQLLGPPLDAPSTYTLLRLLRKDGKGSIDHSGGAKLNGDGLAVLDKWQRMLDLMDHWKRDLTSLKKGEAKIAAALGSVKQAAQAIAAGAGGPELRKVIEEYSAADDAVLEAAGDLKTGFDAYTEAVKGYTAAVSEQALESAKRTKDLAKEKRDGEVAAIESRKNVIRSAASLAASILDPKSWLSIPGALVSIGATEFGAWFSSRLSASKLAQLEKELELATTEVVRIQDELGVILVEKAQAHLQGAVSEQNTRRMKFENKLRALELVGARIVSTMKKSSALTSGANALELRGAVEGAKRSSQLLIDAGETLDADMQSLAPRYGSFASSFEDTPTEYRESARATAEGNATTLYEASVYLTSLLSNVRSTQDYLQGVGDKADSNGLYRVLPELRKAIVKQK